MSKYCSNCKMNFSDEFDECVYCGSDLQDGTIEMEEIETEKSIYELSDKEVLDKYSDYRKRIEEQTGKKMTDFEFLSGIREARRDSLNHQAEAYLKTNKEASVNKPKCPTCQSENIQKISAMTKAGSVALCGIFSQKVKKQWHCNSCGSEW
ncbi:hypothetical protein [Roseburia hominis]